MDPRALGGAAFAAQRTVGDLALDLSAYDGLLLDITRPDGRTYTLVLKDALPAARPDGRERSAVVWEVHFHPVYRGKEVSDEEPLRKRDVKRVSLMMRR